MMKQLLGLTRVVLVLLVAVCPGWKEGQALAATGRTPQTSQALQPLIMTSELVVGQNRIAFGLLKGHKFLDDADVAVRVYVIQDQQAQLQVELRAPYYTLEVVEQGRRVHIHPDGTRHVHHEETDVRGIYVTQVTFEYPGTFGLEISVRQGNKSIDTAKVAVNVLAAPSTPALGSPAPRSRNLIASDVSDLRQIDTSDPPDPRLHQVRIADAIAQGKPQVIVFATPKFCTSRMCGPVVDIVRTMLPAYGDRVVFSHQEIWQDISAQTLSPTVLEWSLPSEPWIFIVDEKGIIRAKFEGLTTTHELGAALKSLLQPR
jgi:hypothetical protein